MADKKEKEQIRNKIKKARNVFTRLNRMFRDGPIVKTSLSGKIDTSFTKASLGHLLNSNIYNSSTFFNQGYDRSCLRLDTKIPVPGKEKFVSLGELIEKYPNGEKFIVYTYDHDKKKIVPAYAHHPRSSGVKETVRVTFDDGSHLICTSDHQCMVRSGDFVDAGELKVGDSMMPFNRFKINSAYERNGRKHRNYDLIYTMDRRYKNGVQSEHKLIAEWKLGRNIDGKKEHVHHLDYNSENNNPENLAVLSPSEHLKIHKQHNHKLWEDPAMRKKIMDGIQRAWDEDTGERRAKLIEYNKREDVKELRRQHLLNNNPMNNPISRKKAALAISGEKNYGYRHDLSEENILDSAVRNGYVLKLVCKEFGARWETINRRIKKWGYSNWKNFVETNEAKINHKVVSVESCGKFEVGDLTVDGYENFATDSIVVHNSRYSDLAEMEYYPELNAALNLYSDETITYDEKGNVLRIVTENDQIKLLLEELFYDTINFEFNGWSWIRSLCKWGDHFLLNMVDPEHGIVGVLPIPVQEVEREEGFDPANPMAVRYRWSTQNKILNNWQITHFRLLGNDTYAPYGTSVLEGARRIWRQLNLLEDAVMVYRIVRSPERRVFKIDVGNVAPDEVPAFMEKIKTQAKKDQVVDSSSGQIDLRYNALPLWKDTPVPLLDGRVLTLEELAKEYSDKKENWVYSIDDITNELKPGKIVWAGKNYSDAKLLKVTLDDGSFVYSAPEHPFILRDGTSRRADELTENDSLMPYYTRVNKNGYETTYDPGKNKVVNTHNVNLEDMFCGSCDDDAGDYEEDLYMNHKVALIEVADFTDDVYCMTIEGKNGEQDRHNFAICGLRDSGNVYKNGIFVKNTVEDDYFIPVRGDMSSEIETLAGGSYTGDVDDIEYFQKKLFAALQIPRAYLGYDEAIGCLVGDTLIPLMDGRTLSIEDIAKEYESGKTNWVYSYDVESNKISAGKVSWGGITKSVDKVYHITLDNGEKISCTDNHPFLLRDGEYVRADSLAVNQSVMPLYRKKSSKQGGDFLNGYDMVYDVESNKWEYTHKVVSRDCDINVHESCNDEGYKVVHHMTFDKLNNSPENLMLIGKRAHGKIHGELAKRNLLSEKSRAKLRETMKTESYAKNHLEGVLRAWENDDGTRSAAIAKANKEYGKIELMHTRLAELKNAGIIDLSGENNCWFIERPKFDDVVNTVANRGIFKKEGVRDHLECSLNGLDEVIAEHGFGSWYDFTSKYDKTRKGRKIKFLDLNQLSLLAAKCDTKKEFYSTSGISATGFKNYCTRTGIDYKVWLNENMSNNNHKITSIDVELLGSKLPVYDITVDRFHNFATAAGVFVHNSKSTLAAEDVRWARTIQRVQRVIVSELTKMAIIHLFIHGYEGEDLIDFDIKLSNPSNIAEQQKLELWRTRFEIAGNIPEGYFDREFVQKNIFQLSNREIAVIKSKRIEDKKEDIELENMQLPADGEVGGGGGGGFGGGGGGDLFGDEGGGDLFGDEGGGEDLFGDEGGGEDFSGAGGEEDVGGGGLFAHTERSSDLVILEEEGSEESEDDEDEEPRERDEDYKYKHNRQRIDRTGPDGLEMPDLVNLGDLGTTFSNKKKNRGDEINPLRNMSSEQRETKKLDFEVKRLISDLEKNVPRKLKALLETEETEDNEESEE